MNKGKKEKRKKGKQTQGKKWRQTNKKKETNKQSKVDEQKERRKELKKKNLTICYEKVENLKSWTETEVYFLRMFFLFHNYFSFITHPVLSMRWILKLLPSMTLPCIWKQIPNTHILSENRNTLSPSFHLPTQPTQLYVISAIIFLRGARNY